MLPLHHVLNGQCSCGKPTCGSAGKHPRTKNGLKDATTDPDTIRGWWQKWPLANIGVVTGPASGFWVLGPDGPEGLADLHRLVDENGSTPRTARVRSGSGGQHLLFRWPSDGKPIPNRKNHRGTKIDVRACGDGPGYVVAPPSKNANGAYEWIEDTDPAEAPPWLLLWARGITIKASSAKPRPSILERARSYLDKCPGAVSGQGGHDQTFKVARALCWGFDLPIDTALDLLVRDYNPRCSPPWSEKELTHKVEDAASKDYGKPRGYLLGGERDDRDSKDSRDDNREKVAPAKGWSPPAALPTMPDVPAFPLDIFPPKVASYWRAAGDALSCPVDYVAVPGLTLLGAAVGRARAAEVKSGYAESPLFWTAVFAPPGGTKSPALRAARAPLQKAEARWLDEHRDRMTIFDTEMDRHNANVKAWKADGCEGEPPEKPRRPTLRQATLDDTTTEATAKVLAENARGLAVVKDELIGFIRGMNQYKSGGKGADREFWLSAWAGAPAKVNRAKDHDAGPLVIHHPFVAVAGMMCPDALAELRGENRNGDAQADGFLDRFLLSFPDPMDATAETWRVIPEHVEQGYCDVFLDLLGMDMVTVQDGPTSTRHRPFFVQFSPDGRAAWEEFTGTMANRMNALDKFDPFRGVLSKLRGYGLRFASLLWCLRRACGVL
ncbi:MAG: DUF3987 domain-containing protein, partial [Gemmataceae bacterium]|nr:DUF3987 domain-containing protein [Gemmataceae bacterium]